MTQIINFVLFLNGLIFGQKNKNQGGTPLMRNLIFCALLILSLFGNYKLLTSLWDSSAQNIRLKGKLADYEIIKQERDDLALTNQVLSNTLGTLGVLDAPITKKFKPAAPPAPRDNKKKVNPSPVIPNRDVEKHKSSANNDSIE